MSQHETSNNGRPHTLTVGLLVSQLEPVYHGAIWQGCAQAAQASGVNLAVIAGGSLEAAPDAPTAYQIRPSTSQMYDTLGQFIYNLPSPENCDGLIITTSSLGTFSSLETMTEFCKMFAPVPVVSLGFAIPGITSVYCNSTTGIHDAVAHQITVHGHTKIAFIRGPEHHDEAEERYRAYRETLETYGIAFDPGLSAPGDFLSINMAISSIQRWLRQGVQTIITANDTMALDAIRYLQSLGVKVPFDVAVIGFDDRPTATDMLPPLTTVRQPLAEMSHHAMELLLAEINDSAAPKHYEHASQLVIRQSCGCSMYMSNEAVIDDPVTYLVRLLGDDDPKHTQAWAEQLMQAYQVAASDEQHDWINFERTITNLAYELANHRVDLNAWLEALTHVRQHLRRSFTGDASTWARIERVWDFLCGAINHVGIRRHSWDTFDFEHDHDFRNFVSEEILATYDAQHLEQVLRKYIAQLGVPNIYIVTFRNMGVTHAFGDHAEIIVNTGQYVDGGSLPGVFQPTRMLLPGDILSHQEPWHIVIVPLYSQTTILGYAVYEAGVMSGQIYTSLRSELSSAVMSMQLVHQLTDAYIEVEERVVARTTELMEQISQRAQVETAREAIYEISEAARNSQDIQELYPQIHSIVARLLPAENFYIAELDDETQMISFPYFVDEHDPQPQPRHIDSPTVTSLVIRRQQPLLIDPDTFDGLVDEGISALIGSPSLDWLGVPLTLHDHTFGALVVQTYDPVLRYTEDDLNLLNFVSDQIALAINRVRTDEERSRLLSTLQRRTRQLETASEITRLTTALRDVQDVLNDAVSLIQERFDFYFTGIYLLEGDPPRAVLRAASGENGRMMLSSGHSLAVGSPSMIGQCTANGEARRSTDVSQENLRYANPWLPRTRSELALPLLTSKLCIGAVSVQSSELDAFDGEDINLLQALMDHIAIAIENAALHERIQDYTSELEAEVEARTAALKATNAELSTFAYSVSHDLRAPLRRIDGFSEAVMEDFAENLPEMAQDYLRRVRHSAQQMDALIEAILELSRVTRSELYRSDVDMSVIVKEILTVLQHQHPERAVEIVVSGIMPINADPRLLRVVLENLLGNAWKFTRDAAPPRIEVGKMPEDGVYFIRDNGVGFDPRYAEKLFAPFQRLHDIADFEGTGIGLATVQRIIRRHGGAIWAESEPGKGATFFFTFG